MSSCPSGIYDCLKNREIRYVLPAVGGARAMKQVYMSIHQIVTVNSDSHPDFFPWHLFAGYFFRRRIRFPFPSLTPRKSFPPPD